MWLWEIPIHQTTKNDEQWWTMHLLGTARRWSLLGFYQMTGTFAKNTTCRRWFWQPKTTTTKAVPLPAAFWRFTPHKKKHEKGWNDALVKGCFQGIYSQEYGKSWGESDQGRLFENAIPVGEMFNFQTGCVPSKIRGTKHVRPGRGQIMEKHVLKHWDGHVCSATISQQQKMKPVNKDG